jgi:hypothetical protein
MVKEFPLRAMNSKPKLLKSVILMPKDSKIIVMGSKKTHSVFKEVPPPWGGI